MTPNELTRAAAAARASGARLLDLTLSNPTMAGISYPPDVLSSLGDARAGRYAPDPLGLPPARAAVAAEYRRQGVDISPDAIALTASTSEAYALLFKLLCDPGDEVLVPQPSYPLFEWLTRLDAVVSRPYRLDYHGAWSIDRHELEARLTERTRAVLVVHPNNPTGALVRPDDREWLVGICADRGIALIADEVFLDYPLRSGVTSVSMAGERRALTFALGGLSKSAGLPQVKLGWIAVSGSDALASRSLERLAVICDTYLSVSTPVQIAAPRLIEHGRAIRAAIHTRIGRNLSSLRTALAAAPDVTLLEPDAGWSAVLRVPATDGEEVFVVRLIEEAQVLVHPGYFFDFAGEAYVVVSLLPTPEVFDEAVARLVTLASHA
jgi:aspartate/methionine/tyrosine aminotransferase